MMNKKQVLPQQLLLCSFLILVSTPVHAQITPDNTLSTEASIITPNVQLRGATTDLINGGAQRGNNLFHSFTQFNINEGQRVYFANPSGVVNILTRVTGNQASNISGILGVDGAANLFLINPSGILFGQNARLDIRGSFVATTANGVQFGNQGVFSATNPEAPPLLTINPSALFFNQINPLSQGIINRIRPNSNDAVVTSSFSPQQGSHYWVGGNVTFDGGQWDVVNNRAELGGLAGTGSVGLVGSGNQMQLVFPEGVLRTDVLFQKNAFLLITGGGAITVNAGNFSLSGNSSVGTFLLPGEGQLGVTAANNIVVNATGDVTLDGLSQISNIGLQNSLGNTGNITINAQSIRLTNQSLIANNAQRSRGNIILNAKDNISLESNSIINTVGQPNSIGKSGDIKIATKNLTLNGDNVFINASNLHTGKGGDIRIVADNSILVNGFASIASTSAGREDSGNIELQTQSLTLTNGGNIGTQPSLIGNSGNLLINASDSVTLSGTTTFINPPTGQKITTSSRLSTNAFGTGNSGQLNINTKRLSIKDGGEITTRTLFGRGGNLTINAEDSVEVIGNSSNGSVISTTTFASGNAGTLNINTGRLSVRDGGFVTTSTSSTGKGGNLIIDAKGLVEVVGASLSSPNSVSSIFTGTLGSGDAGDIMITSQDFSVGNGAQVNTGTTAAGKGGNLTVNANGNVEVFGASVNGLLNSSLNTSANRGLTGNAGDLTINAQNVIARDGGQITAFTAGQGKGGNLTVNAVGKVELIGRSNNGISPTTFSTSALTGSSGNAGDMTITSQDLFIRDGAQISASTSGAGNAGILTMNAGITRLDNKASFNANTRSPNKNPNREQATINLNTQALIMRRGSNITTNATGANVIGGNININADVLAAFEDSDIGANSTNFRGGRVRITSQGIFGTQTRSFPTLQSDITATGANPDLIGTTEINTPDVDSTQAIIELPEEVVDATRRVAQICPVNPGDKLIGEFTITGRGSLPPSPLEPLPGTTSTTKLANLENNNISNHTIPNSTQNQQNTIIEAQGWVKNTDGNIELVAMAPVITPSARFVAPNCM